MARTFGKGSSKWLRKEDLQNPNGSYRQVPVVIDCFELEELEDSKGNRDEKYIVHFVGKSKGLALNVTNETMLGELYGMPADPNSPEGLTAHFAGKAVTLYVDPTIRMGNQRVGGIRIMAPPSGQKTGPVAGGEPAQEAFPDEPPHPADQDEIPF